jgi:hypothetical protein
VISTFLFKRLKTHSSENSIDCIQGTNKRENNDSLHPSFIAVYESIL